MALNWAMLSPDRTPVPLGKESTIASIDNAEVILDIPDAPPALGAPSGGSGGGSRRVKGFGKLHLTDQRLIYVSARQDDQFDTLSIPLPNILTTKYEQPMFGSNFLTFEIKPSKDGGLTAGTKGEIRLKDQGMFSFVSTLDKTRERAIYMKRQTESEADTLPLYEGDNHEDGSVAVPVGNANANTVPPPPAPAPDEAPPGYDA